MTAYPGFGPPHDEEVLAGACLIKPEVIDRSLWLDTERLSRVETAAIIDTCRGLRNASAEITPLAVGYELPDIDPREISRLRKLAMTSLADPVADGLAAATRLHRLARLQQIDETARSMIEAATGAVEDADVPIDQIAVEAQRALDVVLVQSGDSSRTSMSLRKAAARALEAAKTHDTRRVVKTGLHDLDRRLGGGLRAGTFVVLAARPSMGKTTVAASMALSAARAGHGVGFFSVEMGEELTPRLLSAECWREKPQRWHAAPELEAPPYKAIIEGKLSDSQLAAMERASEALGKLPFELECKPRVSTDDIRACIRRMRHKLSRHGRTLDAVFVDHIGKMRMPDRYKGNRHREIADVTGELADIAKQEDVAMVALHQLNRAVETRDVKRPTLADLRDSGSVEEDADVVMFVYRPAYYYERQKGKDAEHQQRITDALESCKNDIEIITDKNRNGPTGTDTFVGLMEFGFVGSKVRT